MDEANVERYRSSCLADKQSILDEFVAGKGDGSYACNHQADLPKDEKLTPIRKNVA
ncbi:hypothetical protein [Rhizobium leguminosarum]|uniref:hypothetical protein n=1 Tax=Rhizobium leguminosarum TaxID=384 RepID=UPI002F94D5A5